MNLVPLSKRRLTALATALALLALAIPLALRGNDSQAADPSASTPEPPLAVLATPAPTRPVPFLEQNGAQASGLDVTGARVATTNQVGSDLIAAERDAGKLICVIATEPTRPQAGAGACATRESFDAKGVFAVLMGDESRELVALLPDGVTELLATSADGARQAVKVANNAIRLPLDDAQHLSFDLNGTTVERDFTG